MIQQRRTLWINRASSPTYRYKPSSWIILFACCVGFVLFLEQNVINNSNDYYSFSITSHNYIEDKDNDDHNEGYIYYDNTDNDDHGQIDERQDDWTTDLEAVTATHIDSQIHWNSTDLKSPPTLYFCQSDNGNGLREIKFLMESILPEYTQRCLHLKAGRFDVPLVEMSQDLLEPDYTNEYDIFVGRFGSLCQPVVERWLHTSYNGRMILFSGESPDFHPIPGKNGNSRIHAFGPLKDDSIRDIDMVLYYFQLTYLFYFRESLPPNKLISERPKGNSTKSTFMIYANSNCIDYREEAVGLLSQIGEVHCDGACQGKTPPDGNRTNLIQTKHGIGVSGWWLNMQHFSNYKFCFVMEHRGDHTGYITEKILLAFSAGCIPIYYGTERIFDIFNRKAFVFYNISEPEKSLEHVRILNSQEKLYEEMLNEPIVANGERTIQDYFSLTDDIGNGELKHKMRAKLGLSNLVP